MFENYTYLGVAITYPITVARGRITTSSGIAVVENSIAKILTTPVGTRYMCPEYGHKLDEIQYEPNDEILVRQLRFYVLEALRTWEKRAEFLEVRTIVATDAVICIIQYRILQSNQVEDFIWPYYKTLKT